MKIKYHYTEEVNTALAAIDEAINERRIMIRAELEQEIPPDHDMFVKYLREDYHHDPIIRQLKDKKIKIVEYAIPIEIEILD